MTDCLFCKIRDKEIPSTLVHEDEKCLAFNDIHPQDKTHILIIPKKHIETVAHASPEEEPVLGHLLVIAKRLAEEKKLIGYKLQFNVGKEGGQIIFHVHLHLIGH
ncbi:MAG: histidine triad nucleotide-binding protein [Patescibacteria group bacterium]